MRDHLKLLKNNLVFLKNNKGQILVEYLLLMVIAVVCATLLIKGLVGRSDSNQGIIIKQWNRVLITLGKDLPTCEKQTDYSTPKCSQ